MACWLKVYKIYQTENSWRCSVVGEAYQSVASGTDQYGKYVGHLGKTVAAKIASATIWIFVISLVAFLQKKDFTI